MVREGSGFLLTRDNLPTTFKKQKEGNMMSQAPQNFKEESLSLLKDISKEIINGQVDDLIVIYGQSEITETKASFLTSDHLAALLKLLTASESVSGLLPLIIKDDEFDTYKEVINQKLESISHFINNERGKDKK